MFIQETNVNQLSFGRGPPPAGAEESQTPEFEKANRAMTAQMDGMFGDGRVRWVGPFSPWQPGWFLVQVVYEGLPGDWILTPSGAAVKHYVPPSP